MKMMMAPPSSPPPPPLHPPSIKSAPRVPHIPDDAEDVDDHHMKKIKNNKKAGFGVIPTARDADHGSKEDEPEEEVVEV
jgi:hypothetical protein